MKFFFALILTLIINDCKAQSTIPTQYKRADELFKLGEYDSTENLLSILLASKIDDSIRAEVLLRYGVIQTSKDKIDSGILSFKASAKIFKSQNNKLKVSRVYQNIGNTFSLKGNFEEAEIYFNEAFLNATTSLDTINIFIFKIILCIRNENYEKGYSIVHTELAKYPSNLIPYQRYYVYELEGLYQYKKNKYDSALYFFKNALNNATSDEYKASIYYHIAKIYKDLKKYDLAFKFQDSANAVQTNTNNYAELENSYDLYASLYEETGNYKKALYYSKQLRNVSDSFFNKRQTEVRLDAEAKYQNEKTKAEKALVEKDNSIKKRNLIISFIGLGLVALLAFVALRSASNKQKANVILASQKLAVQQLANELATANDTKARLFSTIGHDLRSPISSLYAQLKLQELKGNTTNNGMSQQTTNLLDTLEELLVWSKSQMEGFVLQKVKINIYTLFEELKEFYNTAAHVKNIFIINETDENIIVRTDENILKTIFRNVISNALAHTDAGKNIVLHAAMQNVTVQIKIKNACSKESYQKLQLTFNTAHVKSNAHGFGIVLIKEFAQKINATVQLSYDGENAIVGFVIG